MVQSERRHGNTFLRLCTSLTAACRFLEWQETGRRLIFRTITAVACALVLVLLLRLPGNAQTVHEAESFVDDILEELSHLLDEFDSREELILGLQEMFDGSFDSAAIAQSTLGVSWRRASELQQEQFKDVLVRYLAEKYATRIGEFAGARFERRRSRQIAEERTRVQTAVISPGEQPIDIFWTVRSRNYQAKIINLEVDGINMLILERRVLRSLLAQRNGNLDRLIAYLPTRYK